MIQLADRGLRVGIYRDFFFIFFNTKKKPKGVCHKIIGLLWLKKRSENAQGFPAGI
jgi:hypothetical protein